MSTGPPRAGAAALAALVWLLATAATARSLTWTCPHDGQTFQFAPGDDMHRQPFIERHLTMHASSSGGGGGIGGYGSTGAPFLDAMMPALEQSFQRPSSASGAHRSRKRRRGRSERDLRLAAGELPDAPPRALELPAGLADPAPALAPPPRARAGAARLARHAAAGRRTATPRRAHPYRKVTQGPSG